MNTESAPSPSDIAGSPGGNKILALLCGLGTSMVFSLMFALPSGYSYGAAFLLLLSLWFAFSPSTSSWRSGIEISREDRVIACVLLAYFLVAVAAKAWQANSADNLDQPLRAALAVPVLLMLLRCPYDLRWLWFGIVAGALTSASMSVWELYALEHPRAEGFLNIIHFGNIALVFGAFCAAGLIWAGTLPRKARLAWRLAFIVGMLCGAYSIMASGSRGSWVAFPVLVFLYGLAFLNRRNLAWGAAVAVAGLGAIVIMFNMPDSRLKERYDIAVQDIRDYRQGRADTSLGARFVMWEGAVKNIPERPLLGWDHADYHAKLEQMVKNEELNAVALKFSDNLHNSYLQALLFQGVPGLLALLTLYFVPLAGFCRRIRHADLTVRALAYCGTAMCSAYVLFSLTQVILKRNNGIMFYVLALVILGAAMRWRERRTLA